ELDGAGLEGEQRVILGSGDLIPRLELRTALAHDDRTHLGCLPAIELDASELRVGVATVLGRSLSFFMCHDPPFRLRSRLRVSGEASGLRRAQQYSEDPGRQANRPLPPIGLPANRRVRPSSAANTSRIRRHAPDG